MDVPFAGVCMASVAVTTVVLAAGAPEGPHGTCVMLAICVVFYGGMVLLIHGVRRGGALRRGPLNLSPTNEPGADYYNSSAFAHQPTLGAGRGWDLCREDPTNDPSTVYYISVEDFVGLGVLRPAAATNDSGTVYYISVADFVGLGVLRPAAATNDPAGAVNYNSGAFAQQPGLGAGLNENLLGVPRRADKEGLGAVYYLSDSHTDKSTGGPVAAVGRKKAAAGGALAGHSHRFLPFMGTLAASSAVTGLAAGTASAAAGFALFVLLLGGLSLVTLRVLGA